MNKKTINCPTCKTYASFVRNYNSNSSFCSSSALFKCENCSLVFASPTPSQVDLLEYNSSYFINAHGGINQKENLFHDALAKIRYSYIQNIVASTNIPTALEIGPGRGHLAEFWIKQNPNTSFTFIESDRSMWAKLRSISENVFSSFRSVESKFDIIIASHVLEHVNDPSNFLSNINNMLKPGGYLFLEVPCLDYLHKASDEPHLLFFNKLSLAYLTHCTGLINLDLSYFGVPISSLVKKDLSHIILKRLKYKLFSTRLGSLLFALQETPSHLNLSLREFSLLAPYKAHILSQDPSWWLRCICQKPF